MAATFDPSLSTARDRIRDRVGDTNTAAPFKPDETYDAYLAQHEQNERRATIAILDALIARASLDPSEVSVENGETVKWADLTKTWRAMRGQLQAEEDLANAAGVGYRVLRPERGGACRGEYTRPRCQD